MKIQICTNCGSGNVLIDAFVHANDPDDVRTFDDMYCENCEQSCSTIEVEVADDFNIYSDTYPMSEESVDEAQQLEDMMRSL